GHELRLQVGEEVRGVAGRLDGVVDLGGVALGVVVEQLRVLHRRSGRSMVERLEIVSATTAVGRPFTSSKTRARYSPTIPIVRSWIPPRKRTESAMVASPAPEGRSPITRQTRTTITPTNASSEQTRPRYTAS